MPFALQLQQAFIGPLGRVGTLAALPARHAAGVRVFFRNRAGDAVLLAEAGVDADEAVCLVGRTAKNASSTSERVRLRIRRHLRDVATEDLPGNQPPISVVRDDPEFYRLLQRGLALKRDSSKGSKSFLDTPCDIVQVLTSRELEEGGKVNQSYRPIALRSNWHDGATSCGRRSAACAGDPVLIAAHEGSVEVLRDQSILRETEA